MASPAYASSGAYRAATSATGSFAVPSGVAAGDKIVVAFYLDVQATTVTALPSGFVHADGSPVTAAAPFNHSLVIAEKEATGADTGTYDFTFSANQYHEGAAHRFTGAIAGSAFMDTPSGKATDNTSSNTTPAVSMTTLGADRLDLHAATCWAGGTWTAPAGYTKIQQGGAGLCTLSYLAQPAAGSTGSVSATISNADKRSAWIGAMVPPGASAKVSTLVDNFTTQDNAKWTYSGSASVTGSGQLNLVPATSYANKIDSVATYDLTSSALSVQLVTAPLGNGGIDTFVKMYAVGGDEVSFYREAAVLNFEETVSGSTSSATLTYDPVAHAWWRMRHDGVNLLWETAPDGLTWTTQRTKSPGRSWTAVKVQMLAGYFGTEPTPGISVYDNVNVTITPSGIAAPVSLGAPTLTLNGCTPNGLAVPVALGLPTVSATVVPPAPAGGSWWQLDSVARQNRENARLERLAGPLACPNDGEPLQYDPRSKRRRCPYDGWISPTG